jgi:thiamine pyrophosphate-dependent acetolactate synthase large subunit-like protein
MNYVEPRPKEIIDTDIKTYNRFLRNESKQKNFRLTRRRYREKHKKQISDYNRKYREEHKTETKNYNKIYYEHKKKINDNKLLATDNVVINDAMCSCTGMLDCISVNNCTENKEVSMA